MAAAAGLGGGGGGAGFGGAIFIRSGSLTITDSLFLDNRAQGGTGPGGNGSGLGGAIFALDQTTNANGNNANMPSTLPTITASGLFARGNSASSNPSTNNIYGNSDVVFRVPPEVLSVAIAPPALTNASSVSFTVTFSKPVTGVDVTDFELVTTGAIANASITSVTGGGNTFTVAVSTGTGSGTLGLTVLNDKTIKDADDGVLLAPFTGTTVYTIDKTAPTADIVDVTPDPRPGIAVDTITIRFSEVVRNFDLSDLLLSRNGAIAPLVAATLSTIDNQTFTLRGLQFSTGRTGSYQLTLDVNDITDLVGNPLAQSAFDTWQMSFDDPNIPQPEDIPPAPNGELGTPVLFRLGKRPQQIKGTNRADRLKGTNKSDRILARGGNDTAKALGGNDLISGGAGNDLLRGGNGGDQLVGGVGNDRLFGQAGDDVLIGGVGNDTLSGGGGKNMYVFNNLSEGIDTILGFSQLDVIDLRGIFKQPAFGGSGTPFQRLREFVKLAQVGTTTQVLIDSDGNGANKDFVAIAQLNNTSINSLSTLNFVI
ncbi:calcium-binding protein [Leptolyngbya sp. O-77]|uniref:calcium-binding protein n=1 Tax=Leptolyngbya sp. O-77 TaxID=1080068 RepID=UPI000A04CCF9|nr:type I secretion C-terminal target domain-containing protein [Leptolyngbya sp. O-77]